MGSRGGRARRGFRSRETARGAAGRWHPRAEVRQRCDRRTSAGSAVRRCARVSRSGRAARRGRGGRGPRWYEVAAAWWNSSTITTSKCSAGIAARSLAFRLWIEAKTWSNRVGRAPPTHFSPNDGIAERVAERGEALVEDLLAVGDEQQSGSVESAAECPVVECRHHGLAGAGRGDEQVAVMAALSRQAR